MPRFPRPQNTESIRSQYAGKPATGRFGFFSVVATRVMVVDSQMEGPISTCRRGRRRAPTLEGTVVNIGPGNGVEEFIIAETDPRPAVSAGLFSVFSRLAYTSRVQRGPPALPFGWEAVTVLLVGAVLTIIGIVLILYGMFQFFTGTIGSAIGGEFNIGSFFSGFFGAMVLFVVGGVLAGVGGWFVRLWWIFLLIGAVSGAAGAGSAGRDEGIPELAIRVRCRSCGHLNADRATVCMKCLQPV